jgi:hypothetical protein
MQDPLIVGPPPTSFPTVPVRVQTDEMTERDEHAGMPLHEFFTRRETDYWSGKKRNRSKYQPRRVTPKAERNNPLVDMSPFARIDSEGNSTLICKCGSSYTWEGFDDGLDAWTREHTNCERTRG